MAKTVRTYTPALGNHDRTGSYDQVIAVMTRERRWRERMINELAPKTGQIIVDIGSGTGSLAILMKQACSTIRVIAVDPDPEARRIAEEKAAAARAFIEFATAYGDDEIDVVESGTVDVVTSSLVLHQCSVSTKVGILANAYRLLKPTGRLLISDYGMQQTPLMKMLFNQVRMVDGYEDTKANKDGEIPDMMREAGFSNVEELQVTQTPTGSISLYSGRKPS